MNSGYRSTLEKEAPREFVRQVVTEHLESLLAAQIDNASGIRHRMMRDLRTRKFERVTGDPEQIDEALKTDNAFWIYTKDPNVQAFTDLLNWRASCWCGCPIVSQWMRPDDDTAHRTSESDSTVQILKRMKRP